MKKLDAVHAALPAMAPQQIAIALEAVALMFVADYLEHNPPPVEITADERAGLVTDMVAYTMSTALNTAAAVILQSKSITERAPTPAQEANAADVAAAAIAKAAGKLN